MQSFRPLMKGTLDLDLFFCLLPIFHSKPSVLLVFCQSSHHKIPVRAKHILHSRREKSFCSSMGRAMMKNILYYCTEALYVHGELGAATSLAVLECSGDTAAFAAAFAWARANRARQRSWEGPGSWCRYWCRLPDFCLASPAYQESFCTTGWKLKPGATGLSLVKVIFGLWNRICNICFQS